MISKIQTILVTSLQKIDKLQIKGMPMVMVYLFLFLLILSILLFIGAWVWLWVMTMKPELVIMIQFITAITSVPAIGAIGFFGKALVDKDGDDIPDEFEKDGEHKPIPPFRPPV